MGEKNTISSNTCSFATVDYRKSRIDGFNESKRRFESMSVRAMNLMGSELQLRMIMLPCMTEYSISMILLCVKDVLMRSKAICSNEMFDKINNCYDAVDGEFSKKTSSQGGAFDFANQYCRFWFDKYGKGQIDVWHNVYSQEIVRMGFCDNDNLRDLISYILVARDLAEYVFNKCSELAIEAQLKIGKITKDSVDFGHDRIASIVVDACGCVMDEFNIPEVVSAHKRNCIANWEHFVNKIFTDRCSCNNGVYKFN